MARTRSASPQAVPEAVEQLQEMLDGARCELEAGRRRAAGTLAIAGAVRAVDLICDTALGHHSTAASHQVALDLLATVVHGRGPVGSDDHREALVEIEHLNRRQTAVLTDA